MKGLSFLFMPLVTGKMTDGAEEVGLISCPNMVNSNSKTKDGVGQNAKFQASKR